MPLFQFSHLYLHDPSPKKIFCARPPISLLHPVQYSFPVYLTGGFIWLPGEYITPSQTDGRFGMNPVPPGCARVTVR